MNILVEVFKNKQAVAQVCNVFFLCSLRAAALAFVIFLRTCTCTAP